MNESQNKRETGRRPGQPQKPRPQRPDKRDLLNRRKPVGPTPPLPGGKSPKPGWPLGHRIAFILLLFILGLFLWKQMNPENASHLKISYSQFTELLDDGKVDKVRIRSTTLYGELNEPVTVGDASMTRSATSISVNLGTYDQDMLKDMVSKDIEVTIEPERTWVSMLVSTLPWILIFAVWIFILRQMQGGPKGVFSFGKSKAKLMAESQTKVTFEDVAGVEEAKVELQEVIDFLTDPGKFQRLGGKIPKGALLVGPPGTGKTLLARAVAGEAGVPFFSMSGSDFVEMFVGVGASRVRDLFEQGKSSAPCIIFIDEIDAVGRQRGAGIGGGHDEREQTLNQLLVEMDGFESNEGVILLAATNRPDVLDPALLRPGRFDRQIVVDWPDVNAREQILKVHVKNIKVDNNVNLKNVAKGTPGMTGADLANVVNEAALLAARLNRKRVVMADFEEAKDKVMMGSARKSLVITEGEKKLTACHEAGHVLVAKFMPGSDPVHKVSIIARGRALGLTHFLPTDEKHNWSYNYCLTKLAVLLGGRAAEHIMFNDITNGAANDIENATRLARKMVCEWGMSKRLGPLAFGKKEHEIFLGREIATHKDYSEETAITIDQEVRKLVENAQQQAEAIVSEHMDKLGALTEELLKREILADYQIDKIMNGVRPRQTKPALTEAAATEDKTGESTSQPKKRSSRRRRRRSPGSQPQPESSNASSPERSVEAAPETAVVRPESSSGPSGEQPRADADADEATPKRSRRQPRRRKPKARTDAGASADESGNETKPTGSNGRRKEEKRPEPPEDSDDGGDTSFKKRRSRMVRLKIGGRRRTIKKAPAQNIRHIN